MSALGEDEAIVPRGFFRSQERFVCGQQLGIGHAVEERVPQVDATPVDVKRGRRGGLFHVRVLVCRVQRRTARAAVTQGRIILDAAHRGFRKRKSPGRSWLVMLCRGVRLREVSRLEASQPDLLRGRSRRRGTCLVRAKEPHPASGQAPLYRFRGRDGPVLFAGIRADELSVFLRRGRVDDPGRGLDREAHSWHRCPRSASFCRRLCGAAISWRDFSGST